MIVTLKQPEERTLTKARLGEFQFWVSLEPAHNPEDIYRMGESFCIGEGPTLDVAKITALETLFMAMQNVVKA